MIRQRVFQNAHSQSGYRKFSKPPPKTTKKGSDKNTLLTGLSSKEGTHQIDSVVFLNLIKDLVSVF